MERKRITSNKKPLTDEQKKEKLDKQITEFTNEYFIDYCFNHFLLEQRTKGNTKATIDFYKRFYIKLTAFLDEIFKIAPADATIEMLEMDVFQGVFMQWLESKGVNTQTLNSYLRGLRSFGNWSVKKGYIKTFECPIKEVEPPVKIVYTDSELEVLRKKPEYPIAENFLDWRTYCIIGLILNTGARSNTILNLKIKDVDLENGFINFNTTKTHKVARLGLDEAIVIDLTEWINWLRTKGAEDEDYLFCNEYGGQLTRSGLCKSFRVYNHRRGVEKTSIHLMRHTFAKTWIASGGDIISLSKVLTHSELDMVKRYSNLYGADIKKEIIEHSAISQMKTKGGKTLRTK